MGKVLSSFTNGYPGAIARSLDDVVIALPNKHTAALAFGVPVVLNTAGDGVVPFGSSHTAAQFVGVTVRNPSKTPDTYGSDTGSYAPGELVDVLVRGHITVNMPNTYAATPGAPVSIVKASGAFSVTTGETVVALTNTHVSSDIDTSGNVEIVLNSRNLI